MTYYDILGVPHNATAEQIKQAYRMQVRFFHPDLFDGPPEVAEIKTKQLNEAHSVLGSPDLRAQYDRIIKANTVPPVRQTSHTESTCNPVKEAEEHRWKKEYEELKEKEERRKRRKKRWLVAFLVAYIVTVTGSVLYSVDKTKQAENAPKQQAPALPKTETQPILNPEPRPLSGKVLSGKETIDGSHITVTASSGDNYVVSLRNIKGQECVTFFVRSGETATVGVPAEHLYVYFASGDTWYGLGEGKMFGKNTVYSKDDELLDFTGGYYWEYTLYPVSNGNFSETPSNENEFFQQ